MPGVRVAAAGDIACAPGEPPEPGRCRQAATARLIQRQNPAAVIALGDLQYETGALADFKASYDKSWGKFKAKTKPAVGNHEYRTPGAKGYFTYFGRKGAGYYATTIGSWRLYVLNTNCNRIDCARELSWLYDHMEANPTRCSAIAMHHPRYSSGSRTAPATLVAPFWRVAYGHGVDLALAGHDHDYERFAKMDGDSHLRGDGIASFVVGTGGKSLRPKGAVGNRLALLPRRQVRRPDAVVGQGGVLLELPHRHWRGQGSRSAQLPLSLLSEAQTIAADGGCPVIAWRRAWANVVPCTDHCRIVATLRR